MFIHVGVCLRQDQRNAACVAFRKSRVLLMTAVTDVHILANSLYSKKMISMEEVERTQMLGIPPREVKSRLFSAIEARLETHPADFSTLLDILSSDELGLQDIAREMKVHMESLLEPLRTNENDEYNEYHVEKKKGLLSSVRSGIRKLFGAARDMTASFIKSTLSVLKLDIKIFRKYKKRFDKHTNREQVRWWFELWGDEKALKALESKWEQVSAEHEWRLETCRPVSCQSG